MTPLIFQMMTQCTRRVPASTEDGLFGHHVTYTDGGTFQAAIYKQPGQSGRRVSDHEQTEAERPDLEEVYIVVVPTGTPLHFYEVFRRDSDGAIFRALGDARDTEAPAMSTVQIAKTTAERWDEEWSPQQQP